MGYLHYTLQFPVWSSWRISDFYHALYSSYSYKDYDGGKSGENSQYLTLLLNLNNILKTIKMASCIGILPLHNFSLSDTFIYIVFLIFFMGII